MSRPENTGDDDHDHRIAAWKAGELGVSGVGVYGRSVVPLGFDDALGWESKHPAAPASQLAEPDAASDLAEARAKSAVGPAAGRAMRSFIKETLHGRGAPVVQGEPAPDERHQQERAPKKSVGALMRHTLSPQGMAEIRAIMFDPSFALTIAQRDVLNRVARFAQVGDQSGVRTSLRDLAERLDVSSPHDGAVFEMRSLATPGSGAVLPTGLTQLQHGKRSLEMTQAGRTLAAVAPVLSQRAGMKWTDGLDQGWNRLNERFAEKAHGVVDVVVPAEAVGHWKSPIQADQAELPAVGQWTPSPPQDSPSPGVGRWSAVQAHDSTAGVGQWSAPQRSTGDEEASDPPPAGQWTPPPPDQGASAPAVGAWSAPNGPEPPPAVGQWTDRAPDSRAVGQWQPASPPGNGQQVSDAEAPVGSWSTQQDSAAHGVGTWASPSPDAPPSPSSPWTKPDGAENNPSTAPKSAQDGEAPVVNGGAVLPRKGWRALLNIPILPNGLTVRGLLAVNPNITGVRLVETLRGVDGSRTKLNELMAIEPSMVNQLLSGHRDP